MILKLAGTGMASDRTLDAALKRCRRSVGKLLAPKNISIELEMESNLGNTSCSAPFEQQLLARLRSAALAAENQSTIEVEVYETEAGLVAEVLDCSEVGEAVAAFRYSGNTTQRVRLPQGGSVWICSEPARESKLRNVA